ncbi:MAG: hypothetical protein ABR571_14925 [Jatrophihabitans sp.]
MAGFDLSATQLVATALAAITATIAASYLGVSGTVIGAALASVVSAVGNAVYGHSLRTTSERVRVDRVFLRERRQPGPAAAPAEENVIQNGPPMLPEPARPPTRSRPAAHPQTAWRRIAIGSIASFVAVLAVVTGVEVVAGRPLSDLVRGNGGTGTSVFGTAGGPAATSPAGTPTITRTVTPSVVVTTPTVTQTAPAVTTTAPASQPGTRSAPTSRSGASTGSATAGSPSAP